MTKPSMEYPRLHHIERCEVMLVTVAEGDGDINDPVHEVTYVVKPENGDYVLIGELYDERI